MDWRFALALLISAAVHISLLTINFSPTAPPQVAIKSHLASMEFNLVSSKPSAGEKPAPKPKQLPKQTEPAPTIQTAPVAPVEKEPQNKSPVVAETPPPPQEVKPSVSSLSIQSPNQRGVRRPSVAAGQNPPAYPVLAQYRHIEGTVLLSIEVLANGRCGDVRVKKSSGSDLLDEAALAGVKEWQFEPATQNGKPATMQIDVPIVFKLQPAEK